MEQQMNLLAFVVTKVYYHNPSLGLVTKAKVYKGAGQE
jgi:hypothetical protein